MDRQQIGKDAEQQAERFLRQHGLKPVTRNFRCRWGEIDLIMRDGTEMVFIEVRKAHTQTLWRCHRISGITASNKSSFVPHSTSCKHSATNPFAALM